MFHMVLNVKLEQFITVSLLLLLISIHRIACTREQNGPIFVSTIMLSRYVHIIY